MLSKDFSRTKISPATSEIIDGNRPKLQQYFAIPMRNRGNMYESHMSAQA